MKTFKRICIKNFKLIDDEGQKLELNRGQEYTTSKKDVDNNVTVFTNFWVSVPVKLFAGEQIFTE